MTNEIKIVEICDYCHKEIKNGEFYFSGYNSYTWYNNSHSDLLHLNCVVKLVEEPDFGTLTIDGDLQKMGD